MTTRSTAAKPPLRTIWTFRLPMTLRTVVPMRLSARTSRSRLPLLWHRDRGCRRRRALVALAPRPSLRLADELVQLREDGGRVCTLALERLDALESVQRVAEARVPVGERELRDEPRRHLCAERVEPRRLARRRRRRDREHGPDAERPPVEPLEEDGAGRDRCGGGETDGGDGVGELAGRVRRLGLPLRELTLELEHARAVDLAAEVARQQSRRLGPQRRELAGRVRTHAQSRAELDDGAARDADQWRDRGVRVAAAEQ